MGQKNEVLRQLNLLVSFEMKKKLVITYSSIYLEEKWDQAFVWLIFKTNILINEHLKIPKGFYNVKSKRLEN